MEEEEVRREENYRGMNRDDLGVTFLKKYYLTPLFSECERKISHNLGLILNNELADDLWDFFSFYDRILEQREMIKKKVNIVNPVEIARMKIKEFFVSNKENYNKALRILEKLAGGDSKVKFSSLMNKETPRFRTPGHGKERIKRLETDDYVSSFQKRINQEKRMLGNLKQKLRKSIKAEQLGVVLLFEQLEAYFPLKDYKILLKADKYAVINRILNLMNRMTKSGLIDNKIRMEKEDIQLENKLYYDTKDDDSDDEMGGYGGLFSMMGRRRKKKNLTLNALKNRKYESVIDHSLLANLMDKLNSVGYDELEFFRMIFNRNGILRHKKTMEKVIKNMVNSIKIKNFKFEFMRDILQIFENKICNIQEKLDNLKEKNRFIYAKRNEYKNKNNRKRATELLKKYSKRFDRLTRFLKIIVNHKVKLFKSVFEILYEKKFSDVKQISSQHVKMCLQREDLTGKILNIIFNLKTMLFLFCDSLDILNKIQWMCLT